MNLSNTEESFVLSSLKEFVKVWGSGGQSNLNLECRDGLACIKLSFNLGHPTSQHQNYPQYFRPAQPTTRRRCGPARQLKNIERAKAHKARLEAAVTAANQTVTDDSPVSSAAEAIASSPTSPPPAPSAQPPPPCLTSPPPASAPPPPPAQPHTLTSSPVQNIGNESSASTTSTPLPVAVSAANALTTTEAAPASLPTPSTQSVPVYCIATFENCPDEELTQDYSDSLRRYLASEDHLCYNISSAVFNHLSTRKLRGRFVHTVEVVLHVKIGRLWENAASYIRKHLGATNEWSRGNGTLIKLSRIHQS